MVGLKINNHVFRISNGQVSSGSRHYADEVEVIALGPGIGRLLDGDPDMVIADKLIARHGGTVTRHEHIAWRADVVY